MNGIMDRSSAPTFSMGWSRPSSRSWVNRGRPARFSAIHSSANAAGLDLLEDGPHLVPHRRADDAGPPGQVAVFGRVRDRIAHAGDAVLVHQVDYELHLVEAFEVGRLRLVAGVDQGLEAGLDQRGQAAAENDLLAEEVGLGLLGEGGLQHTRPGSAYGVGVGKCQIVRLAGGVLRHRHQGRNPTAALVGAAHQVPGTLWVRPWRHRRPPGPRSARSGR